MLFETLLLCGVACAAEAGCPAEHFFDSSRSRCVSAVTQIAAGSNHTCALHRDGRVSCWGLDAALNGSGAVPVAPSEVSEVTAARALAAGQDTTCAVIGADGRIRCWGPQSTTVDNVDNEDGSPLTGAVAITVGHGFACASTPEGVSCWGNNLRGQLARPLELNSSATALPALSDRQMALGAGEAVVAHDGARRVCAWGDNATHVVTASNEVGLYTSPQCAELLDVAELAVGSVHACVRSQAGSVTCWGERYYGQLGIGGTEDDSADIPPFGTPAPLPSPAKSMVAGASHTCALLLDGRVVCFGLNSLGQTGTNAAAPGAAETPRQDQVRSAVAVDGFARKVVRLGSGSSAEHTCAILDNGSVACWGHDHAGQLGQQVTGVDAQRFSAAPRSVAW